jgi:hypothetical protein
MKLYPPLSEFISNFLFIILLLAKEGRVKREDVAWYVGREG